MAYAQRAEGDVHELHYVPRGELAHLREGHGLQTRQRVQVGVDTAKHLTNK